MVRREYRFIVVGYVVMPEHVHLVVSEPERHDLPVALKALKQGVARRVATLRDACRDEQNRLVWGTPSHFPDEQSPLVWGTPSRSFWMARFYDFNVWTGKKRIEKLRYMHRNPVTRGLVSSPEQWKWSSFRAYAFREQGIVVVNVMIPPRWAVTQTSKPGSSGAPPKKAP